MIDKQDNEAFFTHAVAELGETQPVVAHCAIFNENGVKIVEKGTPINLGLYERMTQHKLSAPIEDCVSSSDTVTGKTLKASAEIILDEITFFARMVPDTKSRALLLDAFHSPSHCQFAVDTTRPQPRTR